MTKFNTGKLKNSLQKQKRGDNMLVAKHRASTQITDVKRTDKSVVLRSKAEQIQFSESDLHKGRYTEKGTRIDTRRFH